jgi:Trk-type K+ transport system membrane component
MTVDLSLLQVLVSIVLPLVVGIVVKQVGSPAIRSITLALLSAVTAIATAGLSSGGSISKDTAISAVASFIVAVGAYYGLWKPTGISSAVNDKTANFGIAGKEITSNS